MIGPIPLPCEIVKRDGEKLLGFLLDVIPVAPSGLAYIFQMNVTGELRVFGYAEVQVFSKVGFEMRVPGKIQSAGGLGRVS